MKGPQRLTALEAAFVGLERPGLAMHVGGVVVFGGPGATPVTMPELRRHVANRLSRLPRFHARLATPFGGARPRWEPVKRVRMSDHVFHHSLRAPGHAAQLQSLCARIHSVPLDRSQPLWEIHLIDGVDRGRQALIVKTHHAVTDGIAGIEVAEALFDPAAGEARPRLRALGYGEGAGRGPWSALQAILGLGFMAAGGPIALEGPFNGPVGDRRSFGAAALSMDDVRDVKSRTGGSVDDVVMALVAGGLDRYLRDVGYPSVPASLRAMVPVSTRSVDRSRGVRLGNHVSSVFVDLPMATGGDLAGLVRAVAASKATLRTAHAAAGSTLLVEAAGLLPAPLHRAVVRIAMSLPIANLVLSDVPGPDTPMYLLGRRIEACYPMLPLAGGVGLTIATLSMGGVMGVGVTADPDLVPDAGRIATAIRDVLVEAGTTSRPRKAVRPRAA